MCIKDSTNDDVISLELVGRESETERSSNGSCRMHLSENSFQNISDKIE